MSRYLEFPYPGTASSLEWIFLRRKSKIPKSRGVTSVSLKTEKVEGERSGTVAQQARGQDVRAPAYNCPPGL